MSQNLSRGSDTLVAVLSIALLPGCGGEPEWVGVYENCKEQMSAQTAEMQQNSREAGGDPQAEAMLNSLNTMASNMAMAACEMIKSSCEQDPDGATCQAYIERAPGR